MEIDRAPREASPGNLPVQLTSFVGRARELSEARAMLRSTRLLTLTGAGGCGKTRLALRLAGDARERYPDGVWWLDLAPLSDPAHVGSALARELGVRPLPGRTPLEAAVEHLATRRTLVMVDNCEHLIEPCRELATSILRACPDASLLATSREPLGVAGETTWRVPSLSLPLEPASESATSLASSDAVRLFAKRAAEIHPGFSVTGANARGIEEICRHLDGIPLAIELAASRVRVLSIDELAVGLADRFNLLTDGRTASARWRTLRESVDWSHELLSDSERTLLRRLGVFTGSFTLDAVERVCCGDELAPDATLDLVTSLVDKSLVQVDQRSSSNSSTRFRLLETVREYALESLEAAADTERIRRRHADAYAALAERARHDLRTPRYRGSLEVLDADAANIYAAIDWGVEVEPETALRLCASLYVWWLWRGLLADGGAAMDRALEAGAGERSALRGRVLAARAYIAGMAADVETARRRAHEALELGDELDEDSIRARALLVVGNTSLIADPPSSVDSLRRGLELARSVEDRWCEADASQMLAIGRAQMGDWDEVRRELDRSQELARRFGFPDLGAWNHLAAAQGVYPTGARRHCKALLERAAEEAGSDTGQPVVAGIATAQVGLLVVDEGRPAEALALLEPCYERMVVAGAGLALGFLEMAIGVAEAAGGQHADARARLAALAELAAGGSLWFEAQTLRELARVERVNGDVVSAQAHAKRAVALAKRLTNEFFVARAEHQLGRLAGARGEWHDAERVLHAALGVQAERGYRIDLPDSLDGLAEVAAALEGEAEAARLLAAAASGRSELGLVPWTGERERRAALERRVRAALGDHGFTTAWTEGEALSLTEAVGYARRARGSRSRPSTGWEGLTPTELEVVRHAAAGLTNPQIGKRMFITRGTVKTHLSHVYAKLGLRNRAELAAEAARRDEVPQAPSA